MIVDEYQLKYRIPSLTTDAVVLRKHKNDDFHDILLVTRGNDPEKGKLAFPGGFVDYGEDPEHGCLRELKEETELIGKDVELLTVRGNPKRDPRRHVVSIIYTVNVDPESKPKGADDAKEAKFYDLKDIIENKKDQMAFDHYGVIEELIEKKYRDLYNYKKSEKTEKLKNVNKYIVNNPYNKTIKAFLLRIEQLKLDEPTDYNKMATKKRNLEFYEKEIGDLYEEQLKNIRKKIDETTKEKWQIFDEKNYEMLQIKLKKKQLEKKMDEIRNNLNQNTEEEKLKSEKKPQKKTITISTENNNKIIKQEKTNDDTNTVLKKVKNVLDKTIEDVKEVAKENIMNNSNEKNKREQIEKIKKITNESVDEINRLTKYIVEQSNALIEKLYGENCNKIIFKSIKKEEKNLCKKCSPNTSNSDTRKSRDKEKHKVHKGIRCNGCGNFIWENN